MHRFGRSAQQKMKDRWGGSFVLATILALAGAWLAGDYLSRMFGGEVAGSDPGAPQITATQNGIAQTAMEPHQFQLTFVQVGAFRSEASAQGLARNLIEKGYTAMVTPQGDKALVRVLVGPYFTSLAATDARVQLTAMTAEGINDTMIRRMTVQHNPEVIPATAMGDKSAEIKDGLATMNSYIYEVSAWLESRVEMGQADPALVISLGNKLGEQSKAAIGGTDPTMQQFANLAADAKSNSLAIQNAATVMADGAELQTAMNGYIALVEEFNSLHSGK